ncbi:MAG: HAD family hydrolase [Chloroflexota bacterium]|nr:HAD family hydrolase [Chloroflexota bacterium]
MTKKELSSWRKNQTKLRIREFVAAVTEKGSPFYVTPDDRIAVFDNDGTLWSERPVVQGAFTFDRIRALAPEHPEWATTQPYQAVLENDMETVAAFGHKELGEMIMATHAGLTTEEFAAIVRDWVFSARHPATGELYIDMVYQPMLELLRFLRKKKFVTYIVSGGEIEFMRAFAEEVYGIPPQQVIGSSIETVFELCDEGPVLVRLPVLDFVDDGPGKAVAVNRYIGRRPLLAFGNSDGDQQMLEWTAAGDGLRFMGLVHHTDAEREWAYDEGERLETALVEARERNWVVVDMKNDWKVVHKCATEA